MRLEVSLGLWDTPESPKVVINDNKRVNFIMMKEQACKEQKLPSSYIKDPKYKCSFPLKLWEKNHYMYAHPFLDFT